MPTDPGTPTEPPPPPVGPDPTAEQVVAYLGELRALFASTSPEHAAIDQAIGLVVSTPLPSTQ